MVCTLLAEGINIGVLSKLLGHSSIQVTPDSYAFMMDKLMLNNVRMIREKFVAKNDHFEIYELKENSAVDRVLQVLKLREKEN